MTDIEEVLELRDLLLNADKLILSKILEAEESFRELNIGIPVPIGDFVFAKVAGVWRFYHPATERPVVDMPRNERAAFACKWLSDGLLAFAAKLALENAMEKREKLL